MGVYDFFKGKCPNCDKDLDDHPDFGKCGDIQTKYFIEDLYDSFRSFYPGMVVPFAPHGNFIIGRTCCCNTLIKACFTGNVLDRYAVVVGEEKYEYIESEMMMHTHLSIDDIHWYHHRRMFVQNEIGRQIIEEAMHPRRLAYYMDRGYSMDEICD